MRSCTGSGGREATSLHQRATVCAVTGWLNAAQGPAHQAECHCSTDGSIDMSVRHRKASVRRWTGSFGPPFAHVPKLPGSAFTVTPVLSLTAVGVALGVAGPHGAAPQDIPVA
jgi:hypothetical protein